MAAAVAVGGSSDSKARVSPVGEREGMGEDTEDPLPMKMDGCKTRVRLEDLQVPHLRQSYTWDCGLACCMMVLRALKATRADLKAVRRICRTKSIWTVDLAHLLNDFGLEVHFFTITVGANPEFVGESFYKDNMEEDRSRVEMLFRLAPERGIRVERRSISSGEMRDIVLSGEYLVIALVDKSKLNPPWVSIAAGTYLPAYCCGLIGGYTGHYIVVCGYNEERREYLIRDPASSHATIWVRDEGFDRARKCFGTDEDLLFVRTSIVLDGTAGRFAALATAGDEPRSSEDVGK